MPEINVQINDEIKILSNEEAILFEADRKERENSTVSYSDLENIKQKKIDIFNKLGLSAEETQLLLGGI
jgi:CRISPR/Cas system CMR-associated protein Cmr3 (group 5 of RAMP superfamily)